MDIKDLHVHMIEINPNNCMIYKIFENKNSTKFILYSKHKLFELENFFKNKKINFHKFLWIHQSKNNLKKNVYTYTVKFNKIENRKFNKNNFNFAHCI